MKILIIGDFHGKFNLPIKKTIKKEKIDLILSPGDYCGNEMLGKLFFKYYYDSEEEPPQWVEKKIKKLDVQSIMDGFKVVKKIKENKVPFFGVMGNWDPTIYEWDVGSGKRETDNTYARRFSKMQNKKFRFVDFKFIELEDMIIIGGGSTTYPGKIDKKSLKVEEELGRDGRKKVRDYRRREKKYISMFKRVKKKNKPVIFITHNCPYETKLDSVKAGPQKGKHYGSFLEKQIIRRFQPEVVICGHMHENQGRDKLRKSVLINAGAVMDKRYAVLDFDEVKGKVRKVKFY